MGRILAIGDIHGCSLALNCLLEMIDLHPQDTFYDGLNWLVFWDKFYQPEPNYSY